MTAAAKTKLEIAMTTPDDRRGRRPTAAFFLTGVGVGVGVRVGVGVIVVEGTRMVKEVTGATEEVMVTTGSGIVVVVDTTDLAAGT